MQVGDLYIYIYIYIYIYACFIYLLLMNHCRTRVFMWQGVPYVIYWKSMFSCYAVSHFRQALLSVVQRYDFLLLHQD